MISFNVGIDFIDDRILELLYIYSLHGLMILEGVHIVD